MTVDRFALTTAVSRREMIAMVGGGAAATLAAPTSVASAQRRRLPVVGYLCPEAPDLFASRLSAFHAGLGETGYVDGRNIAFEYRWAAGRYGDLPALAADLVAREVDVIVAPGGAQTALAAKKAGARRPIVFEMGGDPVKLGVVDSLSRPGSNITGVSSLSVEVSRKRLEIMRELLPRAAVLGVVSNPTSPTAGSQLQDVRAAAEVLGVPLRIIEASTELEFEPAIAAAAAERVGGLVFTSDPYFAFRGRRLAELALQYRLPAITQSRDFPNAGGLMSYGGDFTQSHRRSGVYTGRVVNGERPADLPVQLVTRLEMFVNLKTAAALALEVPPSLISGADEVIE